MKLLSLLFLLVFSMTSPAGAADDEANRKILKDAIVGAITGATATEVTKDEKKSSEAVADVQTAGDTDSDHKGHSKKEKRGHGKKNFSHGPKKRPHGWDQGKKTGWGDSSVPPGHTKKKNG